MNSTEKKLLGNDAKQTMQEIVAKYASEMRCNCDLDNWEPETSTGHSHVCRIHKAAIEQFYRKPLRKGAP